MAHSNVLGWWKHTGVEDPLETATKHVRGSPLGLKHADQPHQTVAWIIITPTIFACAGLAKRYTDTSLSIPFHAKDLAACCFCPFARLLATRHAWGLPPRGLVHAA